MRRLKIGVIAHILEPIPPRGYGGTELIISQLVEGLVAKGHDVTLFATGNSKTKARLVAAVKKGYFAHPGGRLDTVFAKHLLEIASKAKGFDVWSNHVPHATLALAPLLPAPFVTTLHGIWLPERQELFEAASASSHFVSISDKQQGFYRNVRFLGTIYNGIDTDQLKPGKGGDYYLWVGRFADKKGPVEAIKIARRAGVPLKLAAPLRPAPEPDQAYFDAKIKPLLGDGIEYVGEMASKDKAKVFGGAKALLSPLKWEEPFGLVAAEAMACGTPVLTTTKGAMPELVVHGVTGFLGRRPSDLVRYVKAVEQLDRDRIRKHAVDHFSISRMVDRYEAAFRRLASRRPRGAGKS